MTKRTSQVAERTSTAGVLEYDDEQPEVDIVEGRRSAPTTSVPDWVTLSGISPEALAVYGVLKMHLNRQRGDHLAWPSTRSIAKLVGRSRGDKIGPELAALEELGAIDIIQTGKMPRRYTYRVHTDPPAGYAGPLTLSDWYDRHRDELEAAKAKEKEQRDARRDRRKKSQAAAVTPKTGGQDGGGPVTPKTGGHVTPGTGGHVTPISGREPIRREPLRKEQTPPLPPSEIADSAAVPDTRPDVAVGAAASAGSPSQGGGFDSNKTPTTADAVAWFCSTTTGKALADKYPGWRRPTVEKVFTDATAAGHTLHDTGVALLKLARGQLPVDGPTLSAGRLMSIQHLWQSPPEKLKPEKPAFERCPKFGHEVGRKDDCDVCRREAAVADAEPEPARQVVVLAGSLGKRKLASR